MGQLLAAVFNGRVPVRGKKPLTAARESRDQISAPDGRPNLGSSGSVRHVATVLHEQAGDPTESLESRRSTENMRRVKTQPEKRQRPFNELICLVKYGARKAPNPGTVMIGKFLFL